MPLDIDLQGAPNTTHVCNWVKQAVTIVTAIANSALQLITNNNKNTLSLWDESTVTDRELVTKVLPHCELLILLNQMRHLPFSSQRICFYFNIFISNTNIQASLTHEPLSTLVFVLDKFVYSRSVFPPQTLEVGMETTRGVCPSQWRRVSSSPIARCGARRMTRRQCCHTPGWLHPSGVEGVGPYGVARGINKTFCTMSMNKFDSLLLCCTFMTIFASTWVPTLRFNCDTCWIYPFGIYLQAGLGLEAA